MGMRSPDGRQAGFGVFPRDDALFFNNASPLRAGWEALQVARSNLISVLFLPEIASSPPLADPRDRDDRMGEPVPKL